MCYIWQISDVLVAGRVRLRSRMKHLTQPSRVLLNSSSTWRLHTNVSKVTTICKEVIIGVMHVVMTPANSDACRCFLSKTPPPQFTKNVHKVGQNHTVPCSTPSICGYKHLVIDRNLSIPQVYCMSDNYPYILTDVRQGNGAIKQISNEYTALEFCDATTYVWFFCLCAITLAYWNTRKCALIVWL